MNNKEKLWVVYFNRYIKIEGERIPAIGCAVASGIYPETAKKFIHDKLKKDKVLKKLNPASHLDLEAYDITERAKVGYIIFQ